jgi:hypothetical protein
LDGCLFVSFVSFLVGRLYGWLFVSFVSFLVRRLYGWLFGFGWILGLTVVWLVAWFVGRFAGCMVGCLVCWLGGCMVGYLICLSLCELVARLALIRRAMIHCRTAWTLTKSNSQAQSTPPRLTSSKGSFTRPDSRHPSVTDIQEL